MKKILIIEKQSAARECLMRLLKNASDQLFVVEDGASAASLLKKWSFDFIFSDLSGIQSLTRMDRRPLGTPLIFLKELHEKGRHDVEATLEKPLEVSALETLLRGFEASRKKAKEVIAKSPAMKQLLKQIEKIAKTHSNVFICGESGTGKEVIASLIHAQSKRSSHPFIRVNCAALPDTLIESEFFGHEKGAFTGAHTKRMGRFELADQGTLLLDEISEVPAALQAKLLRVVQEQEFERVGGTNSIPVDVRLISTSNRNMKEAIQNKEFRDDLYYRLNVIPLYLPALRERPEDILPLADHFLKEFCEKNQFPLKVLTKGAKKKLLASKWPGNIRQLRNVVEYAVIMQEGEEIDETHLFFEEMEQLPEAIESFSVEQSLKEVETKHILATLKACQNNRTLAAKKLGIHVRTLRNKLRDLS